jgi:hypothetical protein
VPKELSTEIEVKELQVIRGEIVERKDNWLTQQVEQHPNGILMSIAAQLIRKEFKVGKTRAHKIIKQVIEEKKCSC